MRSASNQRSYYIQINNNNKPVFFVSPDGASVVSVVNSSALTTNAWKNWSVVLDGSLVAGTNTLQVQAQDFSGNTSLPLSRSFFFSVPK